LLGDLFHYSNFVKADRYRAGFDGRDYF